MILRETVEAHCSHDTRVIIVGMKCYPPHGECGVSGGYSVIGITSWGDGCAIPETLGVYTNLQFYMDWLANQFGFSGIGRHNTRAYSIP